MIKNTLTKTSMAQHPIDQFRRWIEAAVEREGELANAMVLSTTDQCHSPHSRVVLLRKLSDEGFTFFTNYQSHKGSEITQNPKASLLFFWKELGRQVRIEGAIQVSSTEESDAYFETRPFESQASAWASQQSTAIANRLLLDDAFHHTLREFAGKRIPRPSHWGGYRLIPHYFEFWQDRESRLHDRISYTATTNPNQWCMERLMP